MTELKVIDGNRSDLECKLIEAICLGSLEEAERLSGKLKALPKPDLRLAWDNQQKLPAGDGDA
jgi:hypothetical protein